jgi:hypothetical protein
MKEESQDPIAVTQSPYPTWTPSSPEHRPRLLIPVGITRVPCSLTLANDPQPSRGADTQHGPLQ